MMADTPKTTMESTAPPTVKLRDSCHACASSKLRCSKEKPTCARCAKRGRTCEYFATRRAGRKQTTKANSQSSIPLIVPSPAPAATTAAAVRFPTLTPPPSNHTQIHSTYLDAIPSPTGTTSAFDADSASEKLVLDFEDYFSSPMDICIPPPPTSMDNNSSRIEYDLSSWGLTCPLDLSSTWTQPPHSHHPLSNDEETTFLVDDIQSIHTTTSSVHKESDLDSSASILNMPSELQHFQHSLNGLSSSCTCLIQTLGLLNQLFHAPAPGSSSSRSSRTTVSSTPSDSPSSLLSVNSSFADSEHAIECINTMLSCPCGQDSYILTLMSLIIFKALAWYEDAASQQSSEMADSPISANSSKSNGSKANSTDAPHDNTHKSRLTTQSVLGKLHRVQGLINLISQRLKAGSSDDQNTDDTAMGNPFAALNGGQQLNGKLPPFSPALLDQLVEDMRKRVRTVSLHLVNTLRQL